MIRSEFEYREAITRRDAEAARLEDHKAAFRSQGYRGVELRRLMEPLRAFHQQLVEEIESYEQLARGEFAALTNLAGLQQLLIGLRIARGLSQKELAELLDVHPSQVSRDERNDYHGVTLARAQRILEVLGARCTTEVTLGKPGRSAS